MPDYQLRWSRAARKEFDRLTAQVAERIFDSVDKLSHVQRPAGCLRLKGESNLWRIRIGDYRVLYAISDVEKIVSIMLIRHRKDVYRDL